MALEMNIIHTRCRHADGSTRLRGPFSSFRLYLCSGSLIAFMETSMHTQAHDQFVLLLQFTLYHRQLFLSIHLRKWRNSC